MLSVADLYDIFNTTVRIFASRYHLSLTIQDVEDVVEQEIIKTWEKERYVEFRTYFFYRVDKACINAIHTKYRQKRGGYAVGSLEEAIAETDGHQPLGPIDTKSDVGEIVALRMLLEELAQTESGRIVIRGKLAPRSKADERNAREHLRRHGEHRQLFDGLL